ncbi:unnamed protein product [Nesidiocoris tenuis]|uniref:Uncharacterized protein n=2 Tax=Nesidiocoris tenuis TaxID=355587 RepID=A0ABN7AG74_9HEMI|nr:Hypothetical protein NTJ_04094 [Nesidiocoris tenuis]CAB0005628.1 unnamed protein product [Nesidiocoris tenuis]
MRINRRSGLKICRRLPPTRPVCGCGVRSGRHFRREFPTCADDLAMNSAGGAAGSVDEGPDRTAGVSALRPSYGHSTSGERELHRSAVSGGCGQRIAAAAPALLRNEISVLVRRGGGRRAGRSRVVDAFPPGPHQQ